MCENARVHVDPDQVFFRAPDPVSDKMLTPNTLNQATPEPSKQGVAVPKS